MKCFWLGHGHHSDAFITTVVICMGPMPNSSVHILSMDGVDEFEVPPLAEIWQCLFSGGRRDTSSEEVAICSFLMLQLMAPPMADDWH